MRQNKTRIRYKHHVRPKNEKIDEYRDCDYKKRT